MDSVWKLVGDFHYYLIIIKCKLYLNLPWSDVKFLQDVDEKVLHFIPWINRIRSIQNNNYIHVSLTSWKTKTFDKSRDNLLITLWLRFKFYLGTKYHKGISRLSVSTKSSVWWHLGFIAFKWFRNGFLNSFWMLTSQKCHA